MRATTYRGPYKVRVENKDIPAIDHPGGIAALRALGDLRVAAASGCDAPVATPASGGAPARR